MASEHVVEFAANEMISVVVGDARIAADKRVLAADVERVVDFPVDVAHLARRMEQALQRVLQHFDGAECDPHALDGVHEGLHQVGRRLEDVGPDVVKQVHQRVLAAEAEHAQRHVLDGRASRLSMHQVPARTSKRTWKKISEP